MTFKKFDSKVAGSKKQSSEPRRIGQVIIDDVLFSNEHPLGVGYRHRKLFEDIFPHTELDTNLKLLMLTPGRPPVGAVLDGTLVHATENSYLFSEKEATGKKAKKVQRNPVIFAGGCVNVHLLADGTKRLEFNHPRFYSDFTFRDFCLAAAQELLTVARLLGEEDSQE